jgi:hypothetical protein
MEYIMWAIGPTARQLILDIFPTVTFDEAVLLVGLFFEFDFAFEDRAPQVRLRPLEPQLASTIVADIYGLDCDRLFQEFFRRWAKLRVSDQAKGLRDRIMAHPGATQCRQFRRDP